MQQPLQPKAVTYIDVLSENGWNDYFATESIHGAPKTPFAVKTQHVLL